MSVFDMFGFNGFSHEDAEDHWRNVYYGEERHHGSFTHEAIAGAAGFAAMRAYENHLRATGQRPSHSLMKEILAGIAAAEVDKLVETKGLDWLDREKAQRMAAHQAHKLAHDRYGGGSGWEYANQVPGPAIAYEHESRIPYGLDEGYAGPTRGGGYVHTVGSIPLENWDFPPIDPGAYAAQGPGPGAAYPQDGYRAGGFAPPPPGPPPPQGYGTYGAPGYGPEYGPSPGGQGYGGYGPPPQGGYGGTTGTYGGGW